MDQINKSLRKLSLKEQTKTVEIIKLIKNGDWESLDRKKLKGYNQIYRIRSGKIRIIYKESADGKITILEIGRRNDTTYNF